MKSSLWKQWVEVAGGENRMDLLLGDGIFPSAREYFEAGVSVKEYRMWYSVGGWDIASMRELENMELADYDNLGEQTEEGVGAYRASIAYKYCNGDIDIEDVRRLIAD